MAKPKPQQDVVHTGRKSWWNGVVTTDCGQKFQPGNEKRENSWTTPVTCPGCKAGKKHKH